MSSSSSHWVPQGLPEVGNIEVLKCFTFLECRPLCTAWSTPCAYFQFSSCVFNVRRASLSFVLRFQIGFSFVHRSLLSLVERSSTQKFWPLVVRSGCCLKFCQCPPGPHLLAVVCVCVSYGEPCESIPGPRELSFSHPCFNSILLSCNTSRFICVCRTT